MRKNIEADNLSVAGDLTVTGNVTVQGTSDIVIGDDLTVTGDISGGTVTSTGAMVAATTLTIGSTTADDYFIIDPPVKGANQYYGTITSSDLTTANKTWTLPDVTGQFIVGTGNSGQICANETNNRVLTSVGANAGFNGEANLTFDGSTLAVTGAATVSTTLEVTQGITGKTTLTVGDSTADDRIIIDPPAKGAGQFDGTITASDMTGTRTWTLPNNDGQFIVGTGNSGQLVANETDNRVVTSVGANAGLNGEANLTFDGSTLAVTGAATVSTTLGVTGATTLSGGATVATGQALTVNGVSYDYEVEGIKQAAPNAGERSIGTRVTNVLNSMAVTGAVQADNLRSRNAQVTSAVDIGGALTVGTTLGVTGATTLSGEATLSGGATVATGQALTVNGVSYDYEVEGIKQAAPSAGERSIATRVTNVLNSLAVTGAIQGDNLRSRNAQVIDTLTVNKFGGNVVAGPYSKDLTAASATTFVSIAVPQSGWLGAKIHYDIIAGDGTDFQIQSGELFVAAVNKAGTVTYKLRDNLIGSDADSLGTGAGVTNTFTAAEDSNDVLAIKATAASDLTETTLRIYYTVHLNIPAVITAA